MYTCMSSTSASHIRISIYPYVYLNPRLHGDGAVAHGARAKALHDLARGFHGL